MQAYSQDLRDRVLRAVARGERPTEIARRFEVSRVWVYQVAQRYRSSGERSSLRVGGYRRSRVAHLEATVRGWIKAEPDLTLTQLCGQRCVGAVPHGHWKTTTFIAGLRHDGITAPLVLDGPMDGAAFLAYVQTFLCPTLRPGDIVIADNLGSHKVAGVAQAIAAAGATIVYLPPYSPDLNPIEKLFAKLKALLRKAATRSVDALWNHIGVLLDDIPAHECANYFAAAGYVSK